MSNNSLIKNIYTFNKFLIFTIFLFFMQINFLFNACSMDLDSLTEDQKNNIISSVRINEFTKNHMLQNVQRDHMEGSQKNTSKSYFLKNGAPIESLIEEVFDNYDTRTLNSNRKTLTLVMRFPNDVGMAVYPNPLGVNAAAPIGTFSAGTRSAVADFNDLAISPMIEVPTRRVALVIGLSKLEASGKFQPEKANLLTFYPQRP